MKNYTIIRLILADQVPDGTGNNDFTFFRILKETHLIFRSGAEIH